MSDYETVVRMCRERAETYQAFRATAMTPVFLDRAADAIESLLSQVSELNQRIARVERNRDMWRGQSVRQAEALERCAVIVERNLGRQNEKIADVPLIARRAQAATPS